MESSDSQILPSNHIPLSPAHDSERPYLPRTIINDNMRVEDRLAVSVLIIMKLLEERNTWQVNKAAHAAEVLKLKQENKNLREEEVNERLRTNDFLRVISRLKAEIKRYQGTTKKQAIDEKIKLCGYCGPDLDIKKCKKCKQPLCDSCHNKSLCFACRKNRRIINCSCGNKILNISECGRCRKTMCSRCKSGFYVDFGQICRKCSNIINYNSDSD